MTDHDLLGDGSSKVCNMKIQVISADNKTIIVPVKSDYSALQYVGTRPDDIVLTADAFDAIVNQHEETQSPPKFQIPGEIRQWCLPIRTAR